VEEINFLELTDFSNGDGIGTISFENVVSGTGATEIMLLGLKPAVSIFDDKGCIGDALV